MAGTLVKSVMLKITASDGDTEAKLDQISAKAKELAAQHPDLQVKVDSAAASAKLAVLRTELKATANAADGDSTSLGSRLRGLGTATASITGVGDAMTLASGDASMFQKVMAGASLATGLLEPALAGGIVVAAGLGSGLVAAGVGGGIFGLALKGVITDVTTADKANVKLKGSMGEVQSSINHVETEYSRWIGSSASGIESVLAPALKLVPAALSDATQFLGPVEAALQDVIIDVKSAMGSPFWTSTISEWAATSGPMIEDIAVAIGHVIHGVVGILDAFMPMSTSLGAGLDSLTEKFAKWGESISGHTGFQSLISMAKTEAPMAISVLKNLAMVLLNVGKAMTGMDGVGNSKMLLQVLQPLSGVLASLSKNQDLDRIALYLLAGADAGKKLSNTFQGISSGLTTIKTGASGLKSATTAVKDFGLGAKIASAATKVWTGVQAGLDVVLSMNPIGLIVIAIAVLVTAIVLLTLHCKSFRDFWKDAWKVIDSDAMAAYASLRGMLHNLAADTDAMRETFVTVGHDVEATWNSMVHALSADTDSMREDLVGFGHGVESVVNSVVGWFQALPGRIMGAVSGLAGQMFSAGAHVISMLASGIESMASAPIHAVSSIVSEVRNLLPFSPAKKGPLSGSGSPDIAGRKIGQMLAAGIDSSTSGVTASAHRMAGAATITGGAASAASMASSVNGMSLQVQGGGGSQFNQFMATWIKNYVRVNFGGNVQKAFGH